jgi:hypothetical protein
MDAADLLAEMRAARAVLSREDHAELIGSGIPPEIISGYPLVGIAGMRIKNGLYEPAPDGRPAYVTPVLVGDPVSPETPDPLVYARHLGDIVDLVAWHPKHPQAWPLRLGAATWLGCIEPQYCNPDPVVVRRSPLAWLRARCDGLVILSSDPADAYRLLSGCCEIAAEDHQHAAELRKLVRRPWSLPRITVAAREAHNAA